MLLPRPEGDGCLCFHASDWGALSRTRTLTRARARTVTLTRARARTVILA